MRWHSDHATDHTNEGLYYFLAMLMMQLGYVTGEHRPGEHRPGEVLVSGLTDEGHRRIEDAALDSVDAAEEAAMMRTHIWSVLDRSGVHNLSTGHR